MMAVKAIAHSYWRTIKRNSRTFESIPASVKDDVLTLAQADVASGTITSEQYEEIMGEAYQEDAVV